MAEDGFRCGFLALIGRPNTGKSTLMNRVLGAKIAAVSEKPQTTRNRIVGIHNPPGAQLIFVDAPGIHSPKKELNRRMVNVARKAASNSDAAAMLIDAARPWMDEDLLALELVEKLDAPRMLCINKIDRVRKSRILPLIDHSSKLGFFEQIVPMSALTGENVDRFVEVAKALLPVSDPLFPADMITDQPEKFWVAEVVREKVVRLSRQELPYSSAVVVEYFEETEGLIRIGALILVERNSQKPIIIGKGGEMLKKVGTSARREIEDFLGKKVFLELTVKVKKDWWRDPEAMGDLLED